jgi:hypothetical protein
VAECDQSLDLLARSVLRDLERSDPESQSLYFRSHERPQHPIPARAGYVVGYRAVQQLGRAYPVADMAGWSLERVHQELRAVLTSDRFS